MLHASLRLYECLYVLDGWRHKGPVGACQILGGFLAFIKDTTSFRGNNGPGFLA